MIDLDCIGGTPLIQVEGVWVKLECANPGGSVKDRIARFMLLEARRRGELRPGDTVVEATSGNTGIALAMVGAALGHPVLIFMPEHMSAERRQMMEELGAEVRLTPRARSFAGAVEARDEYRGRPGYFIPDQFANPDNTRCHRLHTGRELVVQLLEHGIANLDWFVAGIGTGGTLMGVGEALREAMPGVRVAAVEPEESAVLSGEPAGDHGIMGIGDGFVPDLVDRTTLDQVVRVTTAEAHAEAERIRRRQGYCVGRSAGANLVAALRLQATGARVATVWPDCSDRYVSVGLEAPDSPEVTCPLRSLCLPRSHGMLPRRNDAPDMVGIRSSGSARPTSSTGGPPLGGIGMTTQAAPKETGARLTFDGKSVDLPIVRGTENEMAVDVQKLRAATGLITLDPGYGNSGSCRSAITFIDGEQGILRYRGYPIDELAEKSSFLEVAWLLIHGELPTRTQLNGFAHEITRHTMLHENFVRFFEALPTDAHPMPVCAAAVGALATFYQQPETEQNLHDTVIRLLAKMPTLAAYSYKHSIGQPFMYPVNQLDYSSNFMHMMFATPCEEYVVDPVIARVLDLLFILHADHEQNCSTSTVRMVGSARANLFASIAAGISALWGPLHGGANQQVIEMLESIAREEGSAEKFLSRAKDRNDTTRLMGFGHRVYKSYDPRAAILKKACNDVLARVGISSRLLEIALKLEEIALQDDYFVSRKLYPNVDFYSGVIYKALGIPVNAFTVMFAIGRMPGWIAQWLEMRRDPDFKIARPRQVYTGPTKRPYVEMDRRG